MLLIVGLLTLLAGAVMSWKKMYPYSDYVLVAGAVLVIFRGAIHSREKADTIRPKDDDKEQ